MEIYLSKSKRKNKKFVVEMPDFGHQHHFGDSRYEDFTTHGDDKRKSSYLARHRNGLWSKKGIHTAGFWSRWLLWNKSSLKASIKDIEKRFNVKIVDMLT